MAPPNRQSCCSFILFFTIFSVTGSADAEPKGGLQELIAFGLARSHDISAVKSETKFQEATEEFVHRKRVIPQIGISAGYQQLSYDNLKDDGTGRLISNNGRNSSLSITASYDLQTLFNADSILARQSTHFSKVREEIAKRETVRNIKKLYFEVLETQLELLEFNKLINLFGRIDDILKRQTKVGIFNEIERRQFQAQRSILQYDLQSRSADLDAIYLQLSTVINADVATTKMLAGNVSEVVALRFATSDVEPERLSQLNDQLILENFGRDLKQSKLEFEKFNSVPLPVLYVKASRDLPTRPASDGPQTVAEIGLTIPIDGLFTRSSQRSMLSVRSAVNQTLFDRNILEYRNQIRKSALNLNRSKSQAAELERTRIEMTKLLDRTFLFYSQKRLDVLGTLDIFSKYLQAARNFYQNELQLKSSDADLEYLVGGAS
jgi:outer membrane protein TolC